MKRSFQIVIAIFIATYAFSSVSAQETTGITFSMMKKDGKLITRNTQEQKVLDFFVIGLNSNSEVDAFITHFKKMKLVIDITISYDLVDNKRTGSATFQSDAAPLYLKNAMLFSGVTEIIIDEKIIKIKDAEIEDTETETNTSK
jgi:hypothetical protein